MHFPLSYLSEFLEEYPLYSKFGINQPVEPSDLNGVEFNFFCHKEKEFHTFRLKHESKNAIETSVETSSPEMPSSNETDEKTRIYFTEMFIAVCQSCRAYHSDIIISSGAQKEKPKYFVRKIGQYPAPENNGTRMPKDLSDFLNAESRELYMKAQKNLEMGYGAGAFVYFQKIAESEFDRIIGMVSNPYSSDNSKIADAFRLYDKERQKSKLIEEITPYLPENVKTHGANTLLVLHDASSIPVHELTEEECIKKSKDIDTLLRYLSKKLNEKIKFTSPV